MFGIQEIVGILVFRYHFCARTKYVQISKFQRCCYCPTLILQRGNTYISEKEKLVNHTSLYFITYNWVDRTCYSVYRFAGVWFLQFPSSSKFIRECPSVRIARSLPRQLRIPYMKIRKLKKCLGYFSYYGFSFGLVFVFGKRAIKLRCNRLEKDLAYHTEILRGCVHPKS